MAGEAKQSAPKHLTTARSGKNLVKASKDRAGTQNLLQQNLQMQAVGVLPRIQRDDAERHRALKMTVAKPMSSPRQQKTNFSSILVQETLLSETSYLAGTRIAMEKIVPQGSTLEQTKKSFVDKNYQSEEMKNHRRKGSNSQIDFEDLPIFVKKPRNQANFQSVKLQSNDPAVALSRDDVSLHNKQMASQEMQYLLAMTPLIQPQNHRPGIIINKK